MKASIARVMAAAGAFVLASCATPDGMFGGRIYTTDTCSSTNCKIKVEADEPGFLGCLTHKVVVTPEILVVTKADTTITWELKDGFVFCTTRGDGVFIVDDDPKFQFRDPAGEDVDASNGCTKKYRMKDTRVEAGDFKYRLVFRSKKDPAKYCDVDPWVRNG